MKKLKYILIWFYYRLGSGLEKTIGKRNLKEILGKIKKEYKEIEARKKTEKGIMVFHRTHLILGLAIYNTLKGKYSKEEIIEIVHKILWNSFYRTQARFIAFIVRKTKDPFHTFLKQLGPRNEWFFPCPPWEKESIIIENGVGWHQTKCPFMAFFEEEGIWELTRAYGDIDLLVAALLPNHIELKRDKALCWGHGYCDFLYYKK
jgi:L-2-amino-thiazoline-4-carboxylic acid hydrolase